MHRILFILLLFFSTIFVYSSYGQLFENNGASITINNGATVLIRGDVENSASGTIMNNGVIETTGNWLNNSNNNCFGTSIGTVILSGSVQSIGGTSSTLFNNLVINGVGNKILATDQIVGGGYLNPTGVLQLNNNALVLNTKSISINNPSPNAIIRTTGFIESESGPLSGYGIIKWKIGNGNVGSNYIFPFGTTVSNQYLPLQFSIVNSGFSGDSGTVQISTYPTITTSSPNNRPLPLGVSQLQSVSGFENASYVVDRFFVFDVSNYSVLPQTNLTFSYLDNEWNTGNNSINESNLQMQKIINGTTIWSYPAFGTVNTINNTVTVNNWNGEYNPVWTIVDNNSPLPVDLLEFKAALNKNNQAVLNWVTGNDASIEYYELQKSSDALNFFKLTKVLPGNLNQLLNNYTTTDIAPFDNITYYRLKLVDHNGMFKYSKTENVLLQNNLSEIINVFPNPVSDQLYVQVGSDIKSDKNCMLQINDALGRMVYSSPLNDLLLANSSIAKIDLMNFTGGIYYLHVSSSDLQKYSVKKIILQK